MSATRVVITGVGTIAPTGVGREKFWDGLRGGVDGIGEVTSFDTDELICHKACEVEAFDAAHFLGRRGLRYLDESAHLLGSATALALEDAGLPAATVADLEIGLVAGTALGGLASIHRFDIEAATEGPRYVNPMDFPNTVMSSAAGQTAIRLGLPGLNSTVSAGGASGLLAINCAADYVRLGRDSLVLSGGFEHLCLPAYVGCYKLKLLSGCRGGSERAAPFDVERNGFVLGEGAGMFVVEELEHARERDATIYGEVVGFGCSHSGQRARRGGSDRVAAVDAMQLALHDADLAPEDVDFIAASANGSRHGDKAEALAIRDVFGDHGDDIAVTAFKSMLGESLGAAGGLQVAGSLLALVESVVPPTINFGRSHSDWALAGLSSEPTAGEVNVAMVDSFDCGGHHASMVLRRWDAA